MPDADRSTSSTATTSSTRAPFADARELVDALASFVATKGARGVVVFDGVGDDAERGPLSVRYAPDADTLLERLAAEHRDREQVVLVSSDATVLGTAGREVDERLLADVLPRAPAGRAPRRGAAPASRAGSTRRRARGSSACAGESKRVLCKWGLCSLRGCC